MELLEHDSRAVPDADLATLTGAEQDELAARRSLRAQIDKLERELAEAFVTAYPMGGLDAEPARSSRRRRGCSASASSSGSATSSRRASSRPARRSPSAPIEQAASRLALEKMLLDPGRHRFVRIANRDIGEPGLRGLVRAPAARADRDADGLVGGQALLRLSVSHRPRAVAAARRASEATLDS